MKPTLRGVIYWILLAIAVFGLSLCWNVRRHPLGACIGVVVFILAMQIAKRFL